ncbi:hypothetical protein HF1_10710 [Mycoplasma haemofelis str. Langford 1]|uniref:Uncharacterized protein n=1 Tax=Mycoplasma haemofelis (strain Langford 1) TaxID=941640 RepID=E8ZIV8_MYCHL|nr:hypothetical protein [Mycoplasma haemofelis]CBY93079.1 hypothetical protein HF1_10710 [Mycoplasma haemofelis str. Langford 1]
MSYAFIKIATVGGVTTAAGGGIAVNAFVFPKSEEVATQYEKTTYKAEDKGESLKSEEDNLSEPVLTEQKVETTKSSPSKEVTPIEEKRDLPIQCSIYEVKVPTRKSDNSRIIEEILRKIRDSKETFLSSRDGGKSDTFKSEINTACPSNLKESKNVYVWRENGNWQYSEGLQKPDWITQESVKKPTELETH